MKDLMKELKEIEQTLIEYQAFKTTCKHNIIKRLNLDGYLVDLGVIKIAYSRLADAIDKGHVS